MVSVHGEREKIMLCPIKYNPAKYDECDIKCPLACITPQGFGCSIAFIAIKGEGNGIGINLEPLPDSFIKKTTSEQEDASVKAP